MTDLPPDGDVSDLARVLNSTPTKVRKLIDCHKIASTRSGKWPLAAVVAAALADARRDRTAEQVAAAEVVRIEAAAKLAEVEARTRAGDLIERQAVCRLLVELAVAVDKAFAALPGEIAGRDMVLHQRAKVVTAEATRRLAAAIAAIEVNRP